MRGERGKEERLGEGLGLVQRAGEEEVCGGCGDGVRDGGGEREVQERQEGRVGYVDGGEGGEEVGGVALGGAEVVRCAVGVGAWCEVGGGGGGGAFGGRGEGRGGDWRGVDYGEGVARCAVRVGWCV